MDFAKDLSARIKSTIDFKENWEQIETTFIPLNGEVIVYKDYESIDVEDNNGGTHTHYIPAMKIGNGINYLYDLPFLTSGESEEIQQHINNHTIHVSVADREFWDNKLNYNSTIENDVLEFNRN